MFGKDINFLNFKIKNNELLIKKKLNLLLSEKNHVIQSLDKSYKNNFKKKNLSKYKRDTYFRLIGMGGSSLGAKAIYSFLKRKIKKNFVFIDNISSVSSKKRKKNITNIVVSKSGNTIETIVNSNILIKKKDKNIFITENKNSYINNLAQKLKAEIIYHNNYIGGRYSVLSEVGMLPAELMGLNSNNFRNLNNLIKNKYFFKNLISNVSAILHLSQKKKFNSIIINYDKESENIFNWYQQLVAESLGKNKKGILPIVSTMPRDNHSVMQLYLDGFKNNFFTFYYVHEKNTKKINNNSLLNSHKYLANKSLAEITFAQKKATENVFKQKKIPFRSFEIKKRDERSLGTLFSFFILETILIARYLNINPFNQPSVELIKTETKRLLI